MRVWLYSECCGSRQGPSNLFFEKVRNCEKHSMANRRGRDRFRCWEGIMSARINRMLWFQSIQIGDCAFVHGAVFSGGM